MKVRAGSWRIEYIVKIEVGASEMREDEVADRICALDRVGVAVKSFKEPGIFVLYKFTGEGICPEL